MPHLEEMAAPISNEAVVAGTTYKFTVLSLLDYAAAAKEMRRQQQQPHEVVKRLGPDLPPDMQAALLEMAYRDERTGRDISMQEITAWFGTPYGCLYRMWLASQKYHPELTIEDCNRLFQLSEVEGDALNGQPEGNPTSPQASGPTATETPTESPGEKSSDI